MVASLTLGKKKYAAVAAEMQDLAARAEALRAGLLDAIDADAAAFDAVMTAYAMPKASPAEAASRHDAIQRALLAAMQAPLDCARLCREAIDLAVIASEKGNAAVVSDGGVAVLAAHAGLRGSALNVLVNAQALDDRSAAAPMLAELDALLQGAAELAEATYGSVRRRLAG
jgi:formiminotetrahydrofolate cyclodeaminase